MKIYEFATSLASGLPGFAQHQNTIFDEFQAAIQSNSISDMEKFLQDSTLINQPLPNGEKPLNYAIRLKRYEIVQHILSKYATTLDSVDSHGLTPIEHAFMSGDKLMIGIVVSYKLGNKYNEAIEFLPISYFTFTKEIAFTHSVKKYCSPDTTSLHGAFECAATGNISLISELLETGLDVNATTLDGWSLLHLAAKSGNTHLVKLLLDHGARTDFKTQTYGISPLHVAAACSNHKMVEYLLEAGSDLSAVDKDGSTSLHYAMTKNDFFSAQPLIKKGGDLSGKNQLGISPLSVLAAMAQARCNDKDELKLDYFQALLFAGIAASCIAGYSDDYVSKSVNLLTWTATTLISTVMAYKNTKSLPQAATFIGVMGLNFIPGINIAAQGWRTYAVAQGALSGLVTAWRYRHIETARPIRNAMIYSVNTIFSGKQLIDSVTWAGNAISAIAKTMKAATDIFNPMPEYFKDVEELYKAKMDKCIKNSIDPSVCSGNFVHQEFKRFQNEGFFSLPGAHLNSDTCKGVNLTTCISQNQLNPNLRKHAQAILGIPEGISAKDCNKAFRELSKTYHSDKGGDTNTYSALTTAKDRICHSADHSFAQKRNEFSNAAESYLRPPKGLG